MKNKIIYSKKIQEVSSMEQIFHIFLLPSSNQTNFRSVNYFLKGKSHSLSALTLFIYEAKLHHSQLPLEQHI